MLEKFFVTDVKGPWDSAFFYCSEDHDGAEVASILTKERQDGVLAALNTATRELKESYRGNPAKRALSAMRKHGG